MTRGTMFLIKDQKIYYHDEFNGGMGLDTYGLEAINILENSNDINSFKRNVMFFNKNHHNYDSFNFHTDKITDKKLNLSRNYYDFWFSDYIYIKNLDNTPVIFNDDNNEKITVNQNDVVAFHFGEHIKQERIDQAKEKQEMDMEL